MLIAQGKSYSKQLDLRPYTNMLIQSDRKGAVGNFPRISRPSGFTSLRMSRYKGLISAVGSQSITCLLCLLLRVVDFLIYLTNIPQAFWNPT